LGHRLGFLQYLDEVLADTNPFWNAHRDPAWCKDIVDFQEIDPTFGQALSG